MGLLDIFKPKEAIEERSNSTEGITLQEMFTGQKTSVSEFEFLQIPVAKKLLEMITSTVASFELEVYKKDEQRGKTLQKDHDLIKVFNVASTPFETAYDLKKKLIKDYLLKGKACCYIEKKGSKIVALHHVSSFTVNYVFHEKTGLPINKLVQGTLSVSRKSISGDYSDFFIIENPNKGILSHSQVISELVEERKAISRALSSHEYFNTALTTKDRLSEGTIKSLKESFNKNYRGNNRGGQTVILEEGIQPVQMKSDNPLIKTLEAWEKRELKQISLLFQLPSVQTLDSVNLNVSSISTLMLQQVYYPLLQNMENQISHQLLRESEKKDTIINFNTDNLIRMDVQTQTNFFIDQFKMGILSRNELNSKLNMPFVKNDFYVHSLAEVFVYNNEIDREELLNRLVNLNMIGTEQTQSNEINKNDEESSIDKVKDTKEESLD